MQSSPYCIVTCGLSRSSIFPTLCLKLQDFLERSSEHKGVLIFSTNFVQGAVTVIYIYKILFYFILGVKIYTLDREDRVS
jgi:hypothetical protein